MSALSAFVDSPAASALGLALLHFVWQGFALGALIAGVLAGLRDHPAQARYLVCAVGLALLVAAPIATTLLILRGPAEPWAGLPLVTRVLHGTGAASHLVSPILPLLPVVWGAGALALQLRMIAAWLRAESLRRVGTRAASPRWQRAFDDVRTRLAVRRRVRLLESPRVIVPAVVGWLRPVVLVPASLASGLSPDEIRGLLAHELAHIRRHDYLVNLGQCLVESLLFFHPVTWWLSGRLRAEREFCCDDVALTVGGGAVAYARTLSSLEELRDRTALPALSAKGGCLMSRITRLLGAGPGRPGRVPSIAGIVVVVGCLALGSLMATGCLEGDRAEPVQNAALTGPETSAVATAGIPDLTAVLARLDASVAEGAMSPEMAAMVRAKIESGEAKFFAAGADCAPGEGCEVTAGCSPAACVEFAGSGDGEAACLVIECDETDCEAFDVDCAAAAAAPCGAEGTKVVEFVAVD